jgi:hypothetical protein
MSALVNQTLSGEHVDTLVRDIEEAGDTLAKTGRPRVGTEEFQPTPQILRGLARGPDLRRTSSSHGSTSSTGPVSLSR